MAWTDGIDRAANYIVTNVNWNDLLGAAGSLMQLKTHAHGGTTGEGSQSLGPLVLEDFTDAAAPAAPGAGKTRMYCVSGLPHYRAGAAGADRALFGEVGSDANGDIYYRSGGVLTRLPIGSALQVLRTNGAGTAPEYATLGAITVLDKDVTTVTVDNTAAETDLYRKTVTANTIGATGGLRLHLAGKAGNFSGGGADTYQLRLKFGGTTIFDTGALTFATSVGLDDVWSVDVWLFNSATNAQRIGGSFKMNNKASGSWGNASPIADGIDYGVATEDTTANKDLALTIDMGAAGVNRKWTKELGLLEQFA